MILLSLLLLGCKPPAAGAKKSEPPANVPKFAKEEELISLKLTPEAETRLGIATAPVVLQKVERSRLFGGDVTLPPGARVVVSAPLAGTLLAPKDGQAAKPGDTVKAGHPVFALIPILTPVERARLTETHAAAQGEVESANVQIEAAAITLDRTEKLLREKAGSLRAMQDARAQLDLAKSALLVAQTKEKLLASSLKDGDAGSITAVPIPSPTAGVVRNLLSLPGQTVASGAAIFEVEKLDIVWIRVPVYVGDLPGIQTDSEARIGNLAGVSGGASVNARPIPGLLLTGNTNAVTVDLFYEMANVAEPLRPGQKVSVKLRLKGEAESLVIPSSAMVYDINGGTWVYEKVAPQAYTRRRIEVREVLDGKAILARGPKAGAVIATTGVAELFGTEFGYGK